MRKAQCKQYAKSWLVDRLLTGEQVDSRIIIDPAAYNHYSPNKAVHVNALDKARLVEAGFHTECTQNHSHEEDRYDFYDVDHIDDHRDKSGLGDAHNPRATKPSALNPHELLLTVPFVRDYGLKSKNGLLSSSQILFQLNSTRRLSHLWFFPRSRKS